MGKLIVFEGNECSGKTTVIHLVKEKLLSAGYSVMATREPGGTKAGEDIRSIILDREYPQPINGRTEALLYAASRSEMVDKVLVPLRGKYDFVILDRYYYSSLVYQGAVRGLGQFAYSSPQSQHRPDGKTYDADSSFRCPTYKSMYGECTMHYIKSSTLDKLVDEAVRKIARYVLRNEQAFLEQVRVLTSADQKHTQSEDKKELVNIKKRIAELDNYIKRLYEGNASGKIPDRQFEKLMAQYDSEQQELEERVKEIEVSIHEIQQESENGQQFVRLVQKYRDLTEIDQTALNEFIDKVVVHEATGGRTADRSQQIDIYFNFIGQFMVEDTEEELLMQEQEAQRLADLKERERKDRRNETVRRYRQRKKEREVKQAESFSG